MILHSHKVVKNGNNKEMITYKTDTSKPKCWVEGNQYKFNSSIIRRVEIDEIELIVARRFRLCKQSPICPKCRTNQIQLIDATMLAQWRCRECNYTWLHEPLVFIKH